MKDRRIRVDLKGKNVLVTGGAKGIGEAISKDLAANGANVVINYNSSADNAKRLVDEFQSSDSKITAIQADVSLPADAERLVLEASDVLGGSIDILINNAGSQIQQSSIAEMSVKLWDRVLSLNLTSAMVCSKCVISKMIEQSFGRIINISSISAHSGGGPGGSHYAASKAGMSSLTKSLAKELGAYGITVNSIDPGVILTDMHKRFNTPENLKELKKMIPANRLGEPQDISGAVLFLVSDSAAYINGATVAVNGGLRMD